MEQIQEKLEEVGTSFKDICGDNFSDEDEDKLKEYFGKFKIVEEDQDQGYRDWTIQFGDTYVRQAATYDSWNGLTFGDYNPIIVYRKRVSRYEYFEKKPNKEE